MILNLFSDFVVRDTEFDLFSGFQSEINILAEFVTVLLITKPHVIHYILRCSVKKYLLAVLLPYRKPSGSRRWKSVNTDESAHYSSILRYSRKMA